MAAPAFKIPPQLPIPFIHTPSSLVQTARDEIELSRQRYDQIATANHEHVTFQNTILPLADDENIRITSQCITDFYQYVSPDKDLRDAAMEGERLWGEYNTKAAMREDIFKLVKLVHEKETTLDAESEHYLHKKFAKLVQSGLNIPVGPARSHFESIQNRMQVLRLETGRNLREESGGIWFGAEELDGLPEDAFHRLKKGEPGSKNENQFRVTFKNIDLNLCQTYASNADVRKRVFIGNENKCSNNLPLFKELVTLRAEAARLLGYESHVDLKTQDKMMTSNSAKKFLRDLQEEIKPVALLEREKLMELKKSDLEARGIAFADVDSRIYLWDEKLYTRLMKEKLHSFDENKVREYFPLETTLQGLLGVFEKLFGIVFEDIVGEGRATLMKLQNQDEEAVTWHEDVSARAVWNEEAMGGEFLGYLYLDLLNRDNKYNHPCVITFQPYPSTALLTPFGKPMPSKPTLLLHSQVVSMFHELGHGIHNLVGRTQHAGTYGTSTAHDFVEIPSKMLENWCWTPPILQSLSRHYAFLSPEYMTAWKTENPTATEAPPAKAPLDLMEAVAATRDVNIGSHAQRQLHFSLYDIMIHDAGSKEELEAMDLSSLYNSVRQEATGLCGPREGEEDGEKHRWGWGQTRFSHLFDGYDAGYYCYALATTYSRDLFDTRFRADPLSEQEGRRYRRIVLEKGGSGPEMTLLEEFLGRPPNGAAFTKALTVGK